MLNLDHMSDDRLVSLVNECICVGCAHNVGGMFVSWIIFWWRFALVPVAVAIAVAVVVAALFAM
jgi:hypothetical protein